MVYAQTKICPRKWDASNSLLHNLNRNWGNNVNNSFFLF